MENQHWHGCRPFYRSKYVNNNNKKNNSTYILACTLSKSCLIKNPVSPCQSVYTQTVSSTRTSAPQGVRAWPDTDAHECPPKLLAEMKTVIGDQRDWTGSHLRNALNWVICRCDSSKTPTRLQVSLLQPKGGRGTNYECARVCVSEVGVFF